MCIRGRSSTFGGDSRSRDAVPEALAIALDEDVHRIAPRAGTRGVPLREDRSQALQAFFGQCLHGCVCLETEGAPQVNLGGTVG